MEELLSRAEVRNVFHFSDDVISKKLKPCGTVIICGEAKPGYRLSECAALAEARRTFKVCACCQEAKLRSEFYFLDAYCKSCRKARQKKLRRK